MWNDKKMPQIYETIKSLDEQIKEVHENLSHCVDLAIEYLDCSADTERTMPDVQSALEMLRDAQKELRG